MEELHVTSDNMAELVDNATKDCLFRTGQDEEASMVKVEGIVRIFGFNSERLESKRELVKEILDNLPDEFKEGYTFLNLCMTKDGDFWTGTHFVMEELVALAIGLDLMEYCLPREFWSALPGSMPYVRIK